METEAEQEEKLRQKLEALKNKRRQKLSNSELETKKEHLKEVFGAEKFERMLKEAKDFFTDKEKEARKEGSTIFKNISED